MSDVETRIGSYNPETQSVPVTFTSGAVVHKRHVNAVLNAQGQYDEQATAERVASVAQGVAAKIACGAITAASE